MESPTSNSIAPAQGNPLLAMALLRDYFQGRVDRGEERIALSPPALQALREIVKGRPAVGSPVRPAAQAPSPKPVAEVKSVLREEMVAPFPSAAVPQAAPVVPAAPLTPIPRRSPSLPLEERVVRLAELRAAAENHAPAKALGTLRDIMVFAVGNPEAKIMFVGEAPGAEEESKREPFVGPAGQTLTKMIKAMGLERSDVYISNICKFRPMIPNQGSSNRKPDPIEMASCIGFVQQEIEIIQPEVIVALGATAAEGLLGLSGVAVGRVRAKFHDYQGTPLMVTYHPSYLLHNNSMSERRKVWEDLMKVMERVELPISDKQRAFFLPKGS